ncbi:hypothetical protein OGAPHI_007335 [Ogataea philodendri]|uniref:FAD-binding FR-type domain-containing protein n=1 Tax=Ogataea philodendri TaxID=1378263 RepID=A0A9P8NV63_9ASCO|nr:uncharacterized protein OGAPHI_007335 [Ogataea philodendri]KAH3660130.1 hypothetical protein OGAPHI_007335 [Ogataea philodendri]
MFLIYLLLIMLTPGAWARGITSAEGATCLFIANNATNFPFDCKGDDLAYKCRCRCPAFLGSVLLCIEKFSSDSSTLTKAYDYLLDVCENQALVKYNFTDLVKQNENASSYYLEHAEIANLSVIHHPIMFDDEMYNTTHQSVTVLINHRKLATKYGHALLGYWGCVFLSALFFNIARWCFPYLFSNVCNLKAVKWTRRHFISSLVVKPMQIPKPSEKWQHKLLFYVQKSIYLFLQRLPVRVHILIICTYIALVTILCCVNYKIVVPNSVFRCPSGQKWVNIADRTGIIAITQLPLSFLFSARNNPLLMLTGTSYREFQMYHKWISRVIFVLFVLHTAFYLLYVDTRGDYIARWGLTKWRCANAAFTAVTLTTFFAFFRSHFYEWFKMTHKLLIVVFVVGVWYHCITLGWIEYIAASFGIWAAEYVFRVGKVIISGGVLKGKCKVLFETVMDQNGYKQVPHSIRVEINHSGWWRAFPGAYCWIYFLKKDMFWQAHPFTIVSSTAEENFNQLVFIIRVKEGLTRILADYIATTPNNEAYVPLVVEGPYGATIPFKAYNHSVFIAGGVGMTVVYTIALYLAQTYRAQVLRGHKLKSENSISIVWVAPSFESLMSFKKDIESIAPFEGLVELQIFITRDIVDPELKLVFDQETNKELQEMPSVHEQKDDLSISESLDPSLAEKIDFLQRLLRDEVGHVSLNVGDKPDLSAELPSYIRSLNGATAVIACGPSSMNADVRHSTVECLRGDENVDYFEEELLW